MPYCIRCMRACIEFRGKAFSHSPSNERLSMLVRSLSARGTSKHRKCKTLGFLCGCGKTHIRRAAPWMCIWISYTVRYMYIYKTDICVYGFGSKLNASSGLKQKCRFQFRCGCYCCCCLWFSLCMPCVCCVLWLAFHRPRHSPIYYGITEWKIGKRFICDLHLLVAMCHLILRENHYLTRCK